MGFVSELVVQSIRGTEKRMLLRALVYAAEDGEIISIPRGFVTDHASVPQFLRSWIDQDSGQIRDAAVLHDGLYSFGSSLGFTRARCDGYFYEAMRVLGMPLFRARAAWLAVRMFGGKHWL